MQSVTLIFLATVVTMALAVGQYYVPRSYYFIDSAGHESAPVPLRRLRRSVGPYYPNQSGASANANANANAYGGDAHANAEANANAYGDYGRGGGGGGGGGYRPCSGPGCVGSGNPRSLGSRGDGQFTHQYGPVLGARSVVASSSVGLGADGQGYYDNYAGVSN